MGSQGPKAVEGQPLGREAVDGLLGRLADPANGMDKGLGAGLGRLLVGAAPGQSAPQGSRRLAKARRHHPQEWDGKASDARLCRC